MSPEEVIAGVIRQAEDDAYLHGAWNSRPDVEPADVLDALRAAGYAVVKLPQPLSKAMWPVVMSGETEVVAVPSNGINGDPIGVSGIGGLSAPEARALAAALLAAADASEASR